MTNEKWETLIEKIEKKFGIIERKSESPTYPKDATREIIEFENVDGRKMRLERIVKPKILERKLHYHGKTSEASVEYVTSPDETVSTEKLFVWNGIEWKEILWRETPWMKD